MGAVSDTRGGGLHAEMLPICASSRQNPDVKPHAASPSHKRGLSPPQPVWVMLSMYSATHTR